MVRFNVPISSILGTGYFHYNLYASKYNPNIDETITVTLEVKNVFGQGVSGKSVALYKQGTYVSTETTNSNGVATWSITCDEWGIIHFDTGDVACEVMVSGWKQVTLASGSSYGTLYVNGVERLAYFRYYRQNYEVTQIATITLHSNAIPSDYCPLFPTNCTMLRADLTGSVGADGSIVLVAWDTGKRTINMSAMWHY